MKKGKNKKKVAGLAAGLAVLALCAGTFAWTSYTEWVKNHMQSKGFEEGRVSLVEEFNPPKIDEDPETAAVIDKKVKVTNTSSTDAFVRVSFEEMLNKLNPTTAAKKGYGTTALAKFPVIINAKTYLDTANYTEIADANVKVLNNSTAKADQKATILQTGEKFRLFQSKSDANEIVLVVDKELKVAAFPKDFDFEAEDGKVPTLSGAFSADTARVAQKVVAKGVKEGTDFVFYTAEPGYTTDENLTVWGFGVDKGTAGEFDWAGTNVNVFGSTQTAPSSPAVPAAPPTGTAGISGTNIISQVKADGAASGITLNFTSGNVVTTLPTGAANVWFYNEKDGYFYWCNVLKTGSTTDKTLIDSVTFPKVADNQSYYISSYNLWVGLEAIPASEEALKGASNGGAFTGTPKEKNKTTHWESNNAGWNLTGSAQKDAGGTALAWDKDAFHTYDTALFNYFKALATVGK